MKISIGPISYFWPKQTVLDFYAEIAQLPVDAVYLGETVCYKRNELKPDDWLYIGRELAHCGKQVILSTLTLIEAGAELHAVNRICDNGEFLVEANDMAAVQRLSAAGLPFVAGPAINIYNEQTLGFLAKLGLQRWVLPVELGRDTLQQTLNKLNGKHPGIETEVFAYGKLPLAYSARCFTARAKNLPKDRCQLSCLHHSDGLILQSQLQQPLFNLNGIQIQSAQACDLRSHWHDMQALGVDIMRINPQLTGISQIVLELHQAISNRSVDLCPTTGSCNGYWFGDAGLTCVETQQQ